MKIALQLQEKRVPDGSGRGPMLNLGQVTDSDLSAAARIRVLLGERNSVVAVTGLGPKDKTAEFSLRLALTLASMDPRRVLLVDAEPRNPVLHRLVGCPDQPGLTGILSGIADLDSGTFATAVPNLQVAPIGANPDGLAALLNSSAAPNLFAALRNRFRWTVLNAGVVTASAEGMLLGAASDGLVLGLRAGVHRRHELEQFTADTTRLGMNVLGAVLIRRSG